MKTGMQYTNDTATHSWFQVRVSTLMNRAFSSRFSQTYKKCRMSYVFLLSNSEMSFSAAVVHPIRIQLNGTLSLHKVSVK